MIGRLSYDVREGIIYGAETIDALQRFHASKAFLGATGLTVEGPNDASASAGLIYGTMMRRLSSVYVLADHSKFDRPSLTAFGPWSLLITIVTDAASRIIGSSALDEWRQDHLGMRHPALSRRDRSRWKYRVKLAFLKNGRARWIISVA